MANQQSFEAIRVVGGLLGSKVLQDVRRYQLPGQSSEDYGVEPGLTFNDEIGRYWRIARARWNEYQAQIHREDISSHKLAQEEWLLPLFNRVLGYHLEPTARKIIDEREFPLTHIAADGAIPFVLCGADFDLDKGHAIFGQEGRKRSPMGLVQEYLNAENACLWGVVSNGVTLRLLRDNPAMTRPAYIEVDFARLFDEDNYADFATLWLLLHASRLTPRNSQVEQCFLEQWREKGQDEGERALDNLRYGVADALRQLGTGFVAHKDNTALREAISKGELTTDEYFQQVLRLVYRFLFLLTAEDRDIALLPNEYQGQDYRTARKLYQQGYSLAQLRERARQNRHYDQYGDAWQQLLVTFKGYANGQPLLAQPALGGLFAADQCASLEACLLENRYLYSAIFNLSYFQHQDSLSRINYRDMDTEEFGSVYESLLELIPQLNTEGQWQFSFIGDAEDEKSASGHSRKLTGSYYTPDSLVQELIKSALEPVITDRLKANPQQPREAILSITVCDPACGSGHFLLAAARRLAAELAQIDAGTDQATEEHYRHALRDVVRHCIYGVDLNPMAVELCKTGLWLESIEPGKPLSFLASHVQCGNALVGVFDHSMLENGIPGDAYKALTGDDKKVCAELKKQNTAAGKKLAISMRMIPQTFDQLEAMPEDTVEQVQAKREKFKQVQQDAAYNQERLKEDLFTAAFFASKTAESKNSVPTNAHLRVLAEGGSLSEDVVETVKALAVTYKFLHWPLAFPHIFGEQSKGGFDVMLGNPPWERIKLQEQEFFAPRSPEIASASNAAVRTQMIQALNDFENPTAFRLYREYLIAKQGAEGASAFSRLSGRYPLMGKGDINYYSLFAETFLNAKLEKGSVGAIFPTGICTEKGTKDFFNRLIIQNELANLKSFYEVRGWFKGTDDRKPFCLMTLMKSSNSQFIFNIKEIEEVRDSRKYFEITKENFSLFNPITDTCPIFKSKKDAEITLGLYKRLPVFAVNSGWKYSYKSMFHMSSDSGLFFKYDQLFSNNILNEDGVFVSGRITYLPLLEGKMIHLYDSRWSGYETNGTDSFDVSNEAKKDKSYLPLPRYWVAKEEVIKKILKFPKYLSDAIGEASESCIAAITDWVKEHSKIYSSVAKHYEIEFLKDDLFDEAPSEFVTQLFLSEQDCLLLAKSSTNCSADYYKLFIQLACKYIPKYALAWRDITGSAVLRTKVAAIVPVTAISGDLPLILLQENDPEDYALLCADYSSLINDYITRQKISGSHLKLYMNDQILCVPRNHYTELHRRFILPRVLELTYTSYALKPFADDLGYQGEPFAFDLERRHQLKCELDAYYAKLYGLTRDELRYILDPSDVMGEDYPSETFRVLKNKELREFGEYRTQRLVLDAFDRLAVAETTGTPYISLVSPAPEENMKQGASSLFSNKHDAEFAGFIYELVRTNQGISSTKLEKVIAYIGQGSKLLSMMPSNEQELSIDLNQWANSAGSFNQLLKSLEHEGSIRVVRRDGDLTYEVVGESGLGIIIDDRTSQLIISIMTLLRLAEAHIERTDDEVLADKRDVK